MHTRKENITKFNESKSFYDSFMAATGLHWTSRNFMDKDLKKGHDAIVQWTWIAEKVREFRIMRGIAVGLVIVGLLCFTEQIWTMFANGVLHNIFTKIVGNGKDIADKVSFAFAIISTGLAVVLFMATFERAIPFTDSLLDAFIEKEWKTADFEQTLLTVGQLGQKSAYQTPYWMIPNGTEQARGDIPNHVFDKCETALDEGASKATGKLGGDRNYEKIILNHLFLACKRIRVYAAEKNIRDYYQRNPAPKQTEALVET